MRQNDKLKREISSLNEDLVKAEKQARYFEGKYDAAKKEDEEVGRVQIANFETKEHGYLSEIDYLRKLVEKLTLAPEVLKQECVPDGHRQYCSCGQRIGQC